MNEFHPRQPLAGTLRDMVVTMSEGNPGGLSVLVQMVKRNEIEAFMDILHLDDMNIRGSQIWVAWKEWAGSDMERFLAGVRSRDAGMVHEVNDMRYYDQEHYRACTGGASMPGEREKLWVVEDWGHE